MSPVVSVLYGKKEKYAAGTNIPGGAAHPKVIGGTELGGGSLFAHRFTRHETISASFFIASARHCGELGETDEFQVREQIDRGYL